VSSDASSQRAQPNRIGTGSPAPTSDRVITPLKATIEVGRTFVFDCDGDASFTVRPGPGELALWAPASLSGRYVVLSATPPSSEERYEEGDVVVQWSNGELATFEIGGRLFPACRANPSKVPWAEAKRRGITLRALGNEPSWSLEIRPEALTMITELGARRTELTYSAAVEGAEGLRIVPLPMAMTS
jgi:membrane-bound inhibitor of C-type lysozyme